MIHLSEVKIKMHTETVTSAPAEPMDIGEFHLLKPLSTKNSGFSKWGFCTHNGKTYFIKQFLTPVYPNDEVEISPIIKNKRCKECMNWYENKKVIYNTIFEVQNGNIIVPFRFFKEKSHFYIITEKVPYCNITVTSVHSLSSLQKHILLKVISGSFSMLASKGIIHADMKPENILFKETIAGFYTAKIIDFDASYLASNPPFGDDVQGTPEYFAPESFLVLAEQPAVLSPKVDVFALGIIFHEMLCGEKPAISSDFTYIYEAALNDSEIIINDSILPAYREIIFNMLKKNPEERWSAAKVFNRLKNMTAEEYIR